MSSNFRYQTFVAVSGNLGGKVSVVDDVLSSHEQKIYSTTSLDENCIESEFQTDRNYYRDLRQTYLALKQKLVRRRGYETYISKKSKKGAQKATKADEEAPLEEEQEAINHTKPNPKKVKTITPEENFWTNNSKNERD